MNNDVKYNCILVLTLSVLHLSKYQFIKWQVNDSIYFSLYKRSYEFKDESEVGLFIAPSLPQRSGSKMMTNTSEWPIMAKKLDVYILFRISNLKYLTSTHHHDNYIHYILVKSINRSFRTASVSSPPCSVTGSSRWRHSSWCLCQMKYSGNSRSDWSCGSSRTTTLHRRRWRSSGCRSYWRCRHCPDHRS